MDELKKILLSMSRDEREKFASRCGTTWNHLRNIVYCGKPAGESLAINIERETNGEVKCEALRPDVDWAYIRATACECRAGAA